MKSFSAKLVSFVLYWFCFSLVMLAIWLKRKFGDFSFDQLIYHLRFGFQGQLIGDPILIESFIKYCVTVPILLAIGAFTIELFHRHSWKLSFQQFILRIKFLIKIA